MTASIVQQLTDRLGELAARPLGHELENKLKLHLFDTLGALIVGRQLDESRRLAKATALLSGPSGDPSMRLVQLVAAARATEIDDIHLAACVTPSSVVLPVALTVARGNATVTPERFLKACLIGDETLVRIGLAVNGPASLYRGIWPTYIGSSLASAATTAALLDLPAPQFTQALAIASAMAAGANARSDSPSAKWPMAGAAALNGVLAALSARQGFLGDVGLLGDRWGKMFGLTLDVAPLVAPPDHPHALALALKCWCGARQTMAAIAAFKRLLEETALRPENLTAILVEVPGAYLQMIDRPGLPASRQESFANLRYQFGLAAFAPDALYDIVRQSLRGDERFTRLAGLVRIVAAADLDAHYPRYWPARVTITEASGATHRREMLHAPGDAELPLSWRDVQDKLTRATGRPRAAIEHIANVCQAMGTADGLQESWRDFWRVVETDIFVPAETAAN